MSAISTALTPFKDPISFQQFRDIVMLVGRAIVVERNTKAKIPAFLLHLTFGQNLDSEHKSLYKKERFISSAQLCSNHTIEEIQGQFVMSVVNFPRKQIGNLMSDCLVTGAQKVDGTPEEKRETTVYLRPKREIEEGQRIGVRGEEEVMSTCVRDLSWEVFTTLDLRIGTVVESTIVDLTSGSLKQISGRVSLSEDGKTKNFMGLVDSSFEISHGTTHQHLFWVNPDPAEIGEICHFPSDRVEEDCVLLCTVNGGRVGIEPAKPVADGFRIA